MNIRPLAVLPLLCLVLAAIAFPQQPSRLSAQQRAKPIRDISDVESGMPIDYVLASLQKIYKLRDELPLGLASGPTRGWEVWSDDHYVGELVFRDGKLVVATKRIWSTGQGEFELVNRIFTSIYDNSGQSKIEEGPGGDITRTRDRAAILESQEMTFGKLRTRTLKILLGGKQFYLSLTTNPDGSQHVTLDEGLLKVQLPAPEQNKSGK